MRSKYSSSDLNNMLIYMHTIMIISRAPNAVHNINLNKATHCTSTVLIADSIFSRDIYDIITLTSPYHPIRPL